MYINYFPRDDGTKAFISTQRIRIGFSSVSSTTLLIYEPFLPREWCEKALHDTSNHKTRPLADFNHSHELARYYGQRFPSASNIHPHIHPHTHAHESVSSPKSRRLCLSYKFVLTLKWFARRKARNTNEATYFRHRFSLFHSLKAFPLQFSWRAWQRVRSVKTVQASMAEH